MLTWAALTIIFAIKLTHQQGTIDPNAACPKSSAGAAAYNQQLTMSSARHSPAEAVTLACRPGFSPLIRRVSTGCNGDEETLKNGINIADLCRQDVLENSPDFDSCHLALQDLCGVPLDGGGVHCRRCQQNFTARVDFVCYRRSDRYQLCNQNLRLTRPDQLIEAARATPSVDSDESCDGRMEVAADATSSSASASTSAVLLTILDLKLKASSLPKYGSYLELLQSETARSDRVDKVLVRQTDRDWQRDGTPYWPIYVRNVSLIRVRYRYTEQLVDFYPYLIRLQKACHLPVSHWPANHIGVKFLIKGVCREKGSIINMLLTINDQMNVTVAYRCHSDTGLPADSIAECLHRYGPRSECFQLTELGSVPPNGGKQNVSQEFLDNDLRPKLINELDDDQPTASRGPPGAWAFVVPTATALAILLLLSVGICLLMRWRYKKRDRKQYRQSLVMEALVHEQQWQLQRLRCSMMLPPAPQLHSSQSQPSSLLFDPSTTNQSASLETYLQPSSLDATSAAGASTNGTGSYYFTMSAPIYESLADVSTIDSVTISGSTGEDFTDTHSNCAA